MSRENVDAIINAPHPEVRATASLEGRTAVVRPSRLCCAKRLRMRSWELGFLPITSGGEHP